MHDELARAIAHSHLIHVHRVAIGESGPQIARSAIWVPVEVGRRVGDDRLNLWQRRERALIRRQFHHRIEAVRGHDLGHREPRLVVRNTRDSVGGANRHRAA